jgi:hypothetical protein
MAMPPVDVAVGMAMRLAPVPVPVAPGGAVATVGETPGGRAMPGVPVAGGAGAVVAGGAAAVVVPVGVTVCEIGGATPVTAGPAGGVVVAGVAATVAGPDGVVAFVLLGPLTPPGRGPDGLAGSTGPPVVTTQPTANIEPTAAAVNHVNLNPEFDANLVGFISSFSSCCGVSEPLPVSLVRRGA